MNTDESVEHAASLDYPAEVPTLPPQTTYQLGTVAMLKLTSKSVIILKELDPESDEAGLGRKFLVRTTEHKKMQVFESEIRPLGAEEVVP